jgi:hypothetical protein
MGTKKEQKQTVGKASADISNGKKPSTPRKTASKDTVTLPNGQKVLIALEQWMEVPEPPNSTNIDISCCLHSRYEKIEI